MIELLIRKPDDMHVHLRDGDLLKLTLDHAKRQFARVLAMPNLLPPLTSVESVNDYGRRIAQHPGPQVFYTLYLTDNTSVDEIYHASIDPNILAVKWYPTGVTTNSNSGVTNIESCYPALEVMSETQLVLSIHGEVTDSQVDIFDREAVFIERILIPLRQRFPNLRIVLEHISSAVAAKYVADCNSSRLAATITPQHLLLDRNDLLSGGIKPHYYCLPIVKKSTDRDALIEAATSGMPCFFLGTDSAPHDRQSKETSCGCAGCYSGDHALALYAEVFDQHQSLDKLENFASVYGRLFYSLEATCQQVRLVRKKTRLASHYDYSGREIVPLFAGIEINWSLADD